jgi:hypothetical protein
MDTKKRDDVVDITRKKATRDEGVKTLQTENIKIATLVDHEIIPRRRRIMMPIATTSSTQDMMHQITITIRTTSSSNTTKRFAALILRHTTSGTRNTLL